MDTEVTALADLLVEAAACTGGSVWEGHRGLCYLLAELGRLGPEAKYRVAPLAIPKLVPLLVRWLRQGKSSGFRPALISYLREIGPQAEPAIPALLDILKYRRLRIRFAAAVALLAIGPGGVRALVEAADTDTTAADNATQTLRMLEDGRARWGDKCRPIVRIEPEWLAWNDGTVPRLAAAAREDGSSATAAILADALEEAGCDDAFLLAHLRLPMPHTTECFAVRVILASGRATTHAARFRSAGAAWYEERLAAHEQEEADELADEYADMIYGRSFDQVTDGEGRRLAGLVGRKFLPLLRA